jgi:hypothetical protein
MDKKSVKLGLFVNMKFVYLPDHFLLLHRKHKTDYAVQRTADILCSHSLTQKSPS